MFIAATLFWDTHRNPVKVRNMSPSGALVECAVVPSAGTRVHLVRGGYSAEGQVMWVDRNRCGLHLSTPVNPREWMAPPSNVEQQRVDQILALVKAGAVPLPTGAMSARSEPPEILTTNQLTSDLGLISELIENLGDALASDPSTLIRFAIKLQNLDIAMQMLAAIRNELCATDHGDSSRMARLQDLRTSCGQALRS